MLKRSDITVKVAYETEEDQVIAGLVANGFGIAVVPYMDILEKMSVEIFEIESPEYERSFYQELCYREYKCFNGFVEINIINE